MVVHTFNPKRSTQILWVREQHGLHRVPRQPGLFTVINSISKNQTKLNQQENKTKNKRKGYTCTGWTSRENNAQGSESPILVLWKYLPQKIISPLLVCFLTWKRRLAKTNKVDFIELQKLYICKNTLLRAGHIAQWVKVPVAKLDNLNLISRTYMGEANNSWKLVALWLSLTLCLS